MPEVNQVISKELAENWRVFRDINGLAGQNSAMNGFMVFSANDLILLLPLLAVLVWLSVARWSPYLRWLRARFGETLSERARWIGQRTAITAALAATIALGLNVILAKLIYEPRPFVSDPGAVHLLFSHTNDASFPSDHESVAMAIALALTAAAFWLLLVTLREPLKGETAGWSWDRALRFVAIPAIFAVVALAASALIGFARIYDGVHYPHDIIGGALCGLIGVIVALALLGPLNTIYTAIIRFAETLRLA